ncbi:MAG TPA: polymer-forming cytoskeletal protein [Stellaceae bacterium]|nr:polymer-forming cytoskeletal protein [Stellaceae bacterium]
MSDTPDDLGIPMKPARASTPASNLAPLTRPPAPVPPRVPDQPRPAPIEVARALDPNQRPAILPPAPPPPRRSESDVRKLIVGREIILSGEVTSCDRLIIEGTLEANVQNCNDIDISETGLFKGSASVDEAEVRGRFEGNLTVRRRLMIRASGRITGTVRYGQLEIECGGQITGDISVSDEFAGDLATARGGY